MTAGKESLSAASAQLKQSTLIDSYFDLFCLHLNSERQNIASKPLAQPPASGTTSGLKRRQEDSSTNSSSKKPRTESGATQQSNVKSAAPLPSKPLTPAQAANGKLPPLKRTEQISFGTRLSSPQTTNPMMGNYSSPSISLSRTTGSEQHQQPAAAHAAGAHAIQTAALRSKQQPPPSPSPKIRCLASNSRSNRHLLPRAPLLGTQSPLLYSPNKPTQQHNLVQPLHLKAHPNHGAYRTSLTTQSTTHA